MTLVEALRMMREEPHRSQYAQLLHEAYLDDDPQAAAERFAGSDEFRAARELIAEAIGAPLQEAVILDLGAGTGIASHAFAQAGAKRVYALEPDGSAELGRRAIRRATAGLPVEIIAASGEEIPLGNGVVDAIYARQVLHHATDLERLLREVARVLRRGGAFLACREHVADDEKQRQEFLARHPVHQLVGGENAFPLPTYLGAIKAAGLKIKRLLAPHDSIINRYPEVQTPQETAGAPRMMLRRRFGQIGRLLGLAGSKVIGGKSPRELEPGRLYSFLAIKP